MLRLLFITVLIAAVFSQIESGSLIVVFGQYTDVIVASIVAWLIGTQIRPWFE